DSLQTNNVPQIADYITAPEVTLVLSIQDYQEAIHSQAYAYVIESVIPAARRKNVYEFWRKDKTLFERNQYIAQVYQDFIDHPSDQNFIRVLIANYLLEGLYFYNGFMFFYTLASRSICSGTSSMIRYINRDEYSHCILFENIIRSVREEYPTMISDDMVLAMFDRAVEQEINWSRYIMGDDVVGINSRTIESYTKWLANERLKSLGYLPLYPDYDHNPYMHLDKIADVSGDGHVKSNFFESTVTSYNQSSAISGWDKF
ncbi:MAG: ribonucleotide-diphosphate reductase subunit beta, partial [Leptospiraceae bacterium]|nr:ribonucleotide-diphosphate reductase subunit beta [Leptospiraceae bacterium]